MENAIFEEKKVSKAYMKLSLPLVLSMTVSLIYNLADTFFVAQTQNTNIVAGVSLCAPLFTTLMALGNIFGQGGSSLISRLLGKNDTTATRRVSAFCFWGATLIGVLMGFIMLLFARRCSTSSAQMKKRLPSRAITIRGSQSAHRHWCSRSSTQISCARRACRRNL